MLEKHFFNLIPTLFIYRKENNELTIYSSLRMFVGRSFEIIKIVPFPAQENFDESRILSSYKPDHND